MQVLSGKPSADLRLSEPTNPWPRLTAGKAAADKGRVWRASAYRPSEGRDLGIAGFVRKGKDRGEASSRGRFVLIWKGDCGLLKGLKYFMCSQALGSPNERRTGGTRLVFHREAIAHHEELRDDVQEIYDYSADQYREPVSARRDEGRLEPPPRTAWQRAVEEVQLFVRQATAPSTSTCSTPCGNSGLWRFQLPVGHRVIHCLRPSGAEVSKQESQKLRSSGH